MRTEKNEEKEWHNRSLDLPAYITLSAHWIRSFRNIFSVVTKTLVHIIFHNISTFIVGLQSDTRCKCSLICICESSVPVRATAHVTQPFVAPPSAAVAETWPEWTITLASLSCQRFAKDRIYPADVAEDPRINSAKAECFDSKKRGRELWWMVMWKQTRTRCCSYLLYQMAVIWNQRRELGKSHSTRQSLFHGDMKYLHGS